MKLMILLIVFLLVSFALAIPPLPPTPDKAISAPNVNTESLTAQSASEVASPEPIAPVQNSKVVENTLERRVSALESKTILITISLVIDLILLGLIIYLFLTKPKQYQY